MVQKPLFDFHTAEGAIPPVVKVQHTPSGDVVAIFPIRYGDVSEAESFAESFIREVLNHEFAGALASIQE